MVMRPSLTDRVKNLWADIEVSVMVCEGFVKTEGASSGLKR
jgi:hypothetical protein